MDAGQLKHRIIVQKFEKDRLTWVDHCKLWSGIRPLFAKEKTDRPDIEQSATHLFTIRLNNNLDSTMRILFGGRIYDIQQILPHYQKRDRLEMTCEELHSLPDIIQVKRIETMMGAQNQISSIPLPPRDAAACIMEVQHAHQLPKNQGPVEWDMKVTIDTDLGEDINQGDTITVPGYGDFFVVQSAPGKHFLSVIAIQSRRGAENVGF